MWSGRLLSGSETTTEAAQQRRGHQGERDQSQQPQAPDHPDGRHQPRDRVADGRQDSGETGQRAADGGRRGGQIVELKAACDKALAEAAGDMAKAEEILRVKLGNKAGKAAARITAEGVVAAVVDGTTGALVEINCETDFVSKNDSFLAFAKAAAELVARSNPADVAALSALPYSQDGFGPTLEDVRKGLIGKIGENMSIRRFKRYAGGGALAHYLHGTRIGVVVEFDGDATAAKDVAMHVAAMKPAALSSAEVPAELVEKERKIAAEKAAESGKPADIVAKMVEGSVQKFLKEVSLLDQVFVKAADGKQTVEQYLKAGFHVAGIHVGTSCGSPAAADVCRAVAAAWARSSRCMLLRLSEIGFDDAMVLLDRRRRARAENASLSAIRRAASYPFSTGMPVRASMCWSSVMCWSRSTIRLKRRALGPSHSARRRSNSAPIRRVSPASIGPRAKSVQSPSSTPGTSRRIAPAGSFANFA